MFISNTTIFIVASVKILTLTKNMLDLLDLLQRYIHKNLQKSFSGIKL